MGANFIKVDRRKVHGDRSVDLANKLIELRAMMATEYATMTHMFDGNDFKVLEEHFGLEEGTGLDFYVLLGQATQVLTGTDDLSGALRKQYLDEFTARIGGQ